MRHAGLVAVLLAVSGCIASEGVAPASVTTSTSAPPDSGIEGRVLTTDFAPIPGAVVQLDKETPITTDEAGTFFVAAAPGAHTVTVQALGYESVARSVDVAAGETAKVEFHLDPVPVITPYEERLTFAGYDICSYATPTNVGTYPSPCPLGTPKNNFQFNLTDDWRYFVVELTWPTQNSFWMSINSPGAGCLNTAPCPGVEIGANPERIEGAPQNEAIAKRWALDGKKMYESGAQKLAVSNLYAGEGRETLNSTFFAQCGLVYGQFGIAPRLGCPLGVGYSTGIRFTEYITIFHWEAPADPSKFTALPK